jgi:hypothetical protein
MAFYNKLKWVLGILMIFVLIVATNLIDRNNFVRVRDSVVTIYEDRIIANDIIFEIAKSIQEKEIAFVLTDTEFFNQRNGKMNNDIQNFIRRFEQTKLTDDESKIFNNLKGNLGSLIKSETIFIESDFQNKSTLEDIFSSIKDNLYDLSKIQLDEGRRQMSISKEAIDIVELFTTIEIYLLIFLAITVQIIIIYKPKEA